jgi:hypothetical protein
MPWIFLIDVVREDGRLRFRYRLVGTQIAEQVGYDTTGRYFDEIFDETYLGKILPYYHQVVEAREPHYHQSDTGIPLGGSLEQFSYSRLLCPLAGDGQMVDMLAANIVFFDQHGEEIPPSGV